LGVGDEGVAGIGVGFDIQEFLIVFLGSRTPHPFQGSSHIIVQGIQIPEGRKIDMREAFVRNKIL